PKPQTPNPKPQRSGQRSFNVSQRATNALLFNQVPDLLDALIEAEILLRSILLHNQKALCLSELWMQANFKMIDFGK
ncbi:hypothetical protein U2054_15745, partial [Listeria monocytogenes]